jgi:hypothetical protein
VVDLNAVESVERLSDELTQGAGARGLVLGASGRFPHRQAGALQLLAQTPRRVQQDGITLSSSVSVEALK